MKDTDILPKVFSACSKVRFLSTDGMCSKSKKFEAIDQNLAPSVIMFYKVTNKNIHLGNRKISILQYSFFDKKQNIHCTTTQVFYW